jgi:hypothetical protein
VPNQWLSHLAPVLPRRLSTAVAISLVRHLLVPASPHQISQVPAFPLRLPLSSVLFLLGRLHRYAITPTTLAKLPKLVDVSVVPSTTMSTLARRSYERTAPGSSVATARRRPINHQRPSCIPCHLLALTGSLCLPIMYFPSRSRPVGLCGRLLALP